MFRQKHTGSIRRRLSVVLAVCVVAVAGCSPVVNRTEPTIDTPVTTPTTSREGAEALATEAYKSYLALNDEIASQGGTDPERLTEVAQGMALEVIYENMREIREAGLRITGSTRLQSLDVSDWTDNRISAYVCEDVTLIDLLDQDGHSLVSAGRVNVTPFEVELDRDETTRFLLSERKVWTGKNFCE